MRRPELIGEGARRFGSQCMVVAIDAKRIPGDEADPPRWEVYVNGGRLPTGLDAVTWAKEAGSRGAASTVS